MLPATEGHGQPLYPPPPTFKSATHQAIDAIANGARVHHPFIEPDACPVKQLRYRLGFDSLWRFSEWIVPTDGPELDYLAQAINELEHARIDPRKGTLSRLWMKLHEAGHHGIKDAQLVWTQERWAVQRKGGRR